MDQGADVSEAGDGGGRRACDQCRGRKIRCDKESPCSNCRTAHRPCSSTGQRPRGARQRVLISTQYEKKFDQFEARLGGIESLLKKLSTALDNRASEPVASSHHIKPASRSPHNSGAITPSVIGEGSGAVYDDDDDDGPDSVFEGTSSLAAQTVLASEFLEDAVGRTSLSELSPEMKSALTSLQQIVGMQKQKSSEHAARFPNQKPMPKGGIKDLPMPPVQAVLSLLREMQDMPPLNFALVSTFVALDEFVESCRRVYFATEDFSLVTFIIVNSGLYYLFQDKHILDDNEAATSDILKHQLICRDNLETALSNLPLLMTARPDSIQALLLGATFAVEVSKPSLAWQLNCTAAQLCMTLGYHREPPSDEPEARSALFWFSYMLDRGLALRLGRAPTIQDCDIIKPPHSMGRADMPYPWREALQLWIAHAEVQGLVYEQLYSVTGLARPPDQRAESARLLAARIADIAARSSAIRHRVTSPSVPSATGPGDVPDTRNVGDVPLGMMTISMFLKSDEVLYCSSLALAYRAVPAAPGLPSSLSTECIEAARAAFQSHREFMELTASSTVMRTAYLHWTVLYVPFIPFIVIFCHVIETSDTDDLRRLAEFVASLQQSCSSSQAVDKLHRLCQVLYNVAALYIEAKAKKKQDHELTLVGNDFDMYLGQLGLVPQADMQGAGADDEMAAASNLGDWFSGGRVMMSLLEDDLSMFQPESWVPDIGGPENNL